MADRPPSPQTPNRIVFNGEIYNHHALRGELEDRGYPSRSHSDTEVILHGYRVWGEGAVERMDGMFAWCLVDVDRRCVWLCRDRMGIKPLYLYRPRSGGLLFASEVRAILSARPELADVKLNPSSIESFLAQGAVMGPDSIVDGITALGPGCSMVCDFAGNVVRSQRYWALGFAAEKPLADGRAAHVDTLASALRSSMRGLLNADVPVGLFLSSGIDSAAIATVATEVATTQVRTVSVGFDRSDFDETAGATAIAKELGTEHSTLKLHGRDVLGDFETVLACMDQPTVDGFNTFFVSRAARRAGLTVALSGLGGDELFGGYATFRDLPRAHRLARVVRIIPGLPGTVQWLARSVPGRAPLKLAALLDRPAELLQLYLLRRELFLSNDRRLLQRRPERSDEASGLLDSVLENATAALATVPAELDRVAWLECSLYMSNMLLRDSDVFSMANALELRVPLLERPVVQAATSARAEWRRADPRPKPLLLDAVGRRLPTAAWQQKKRGFTFPWSAWFRDELASRATETIVDPRNWQRLGFDLAQPGRMWSRFRDSDPAIGGLQLLALIVLSDYATRNRLSV